MIKLLALFTLFVSSDLFAAEKHFSCQVQLNSENVVLPDVTLRDDEKQKVIGQVEDFKFYLTSLKDIIEFEVFDGSGPSRHYSSAKIVKKGSFIELAIWKREYLLQARCTML